MSRPAHLPLFTWREDKRRAEIAAERAMLIKRIESLPKMAHRRVELTARLRVLTERELALCFEHGGCDER